MSKKYIILLAVGLSVIGLDQWSKLMAVQYLRHPGSHCYDKRRACERRCREGLARNQGSLVSCNKRCSFLERDCQKEQNLVLSRWGFDLNSMKESWLCRKVSQPWSGSNPECIVVPGFFHFRYQTNSGAAWGLFSDYPPSFRRPFFITITILAILFIIYLFSFRIETEHRQMVFALSLILGGALGNFLDRLRLDYVVDFIYWFLRVGGRSHSWPTFNVADVAITVGVFLIAVEVIRSSFIPEEDEAYEEGYEEVKLAPGPAIEAPAIEAPAPPTLSEEPAQEITTAQAETPVALESTEKQVENTVVVTQASEEVKEESAKEKSDVAAAEQQDESTSEPQGSK